MSEVSAPIDCKIRSRLCPICGRDFCPTSSWAWKRGAKLYCRYNCMRQAEKIWAQTLEERRKESLRRREARTEAYREKKRGKMQKKQEARAAANQEAPAEADREGKGGERVESEPV